MNAPETRIIATNAIVANPANPRVQDVDEDDTKGLVASLSAEVEPYLAVPIGVSIVGEGEYRLEYGSRRLRAVKAAGWQEVLCIVFPPAAQTQMHTLRLVENLHRAALHPIDVATAIRLQWLLANGDALGFREEMDSFRVRAEPLAHLLKELEALLLQKGFTPTRPQIRQDEVLDRLGIEMSSDKRKRMLRLLGLSDELKERVRVLPLTEAGLRAIGSLPPDAQNEVVAAMEEDPTLARQARRISQAVTKDKYTVDHALKEAQGNVDWFLPPFDARSESYQDEAEEEGQDALPDEAEGAEPSQSPSVTFDVPLVESIVFDIVNDTSRLYQLFQDLRAAIGDTPYERLPDPYNVFTNNALDLLRGILNNGRKT